MLIADTTEAAVAEILTGTAVAHTEAEKVIEDTGTAGLEAGLVTGFKYNDLHVTLHFYNV